MSCNFVSLLSLMVTSFNVYQFERPLSSCKIIVTLIVRPLCKIIRHVSVHVATLLAHFTCCHGLLFVSVSLFIYFFILFPLTSVNIEYNNIIPQPPNPQSPNNIMHFRLIFYLNISDTTYYLRKCMLLQYSGRGDIIYIYLAHNIYICTYKLYH